MLRNIFSFSIEVIIEVGACPIVLTNALFAWNSCVDGPVQCVCVSACIREWLNPTEVWSGEASGIESW